MIIHCNAYTMLQIYLITRILDRFYLNLKFDSHASSLSTCIFTSFEISPSLCVLIHSQPLFLLTRNQPKMRCCFVALKQYFRNVLVSLLFLPSHLFILFVIISKEERRWWCFFRSWVLFCGSVSMIGNYKTSTQYITCSDTWFR